MSGLCIGSYCVTITDLNGCINYACITINSPVIYGCIDPLGENYDFNATVDDSSYLYGNWYL